MKCAICRNGHTGASDVTVVLERQGSTLVFRGVPAQVCGNCGEQYLSDETNRILLEKAEKAVADGAELELLRYAA